MKRFIKGSKILFALKWVMELFLRSEAPGLVFSATYPRGSLAPSAFPSTRLVGELKSCRSGLRLPPQISHEKDDGLPPVTSEKLHFPQCRRSMQTI